MRAAIISGSHRVDSQSGKVARHIARLIEASASPAPYLLDLGKTPLPLWDEGVWAGSPEWQQVWGPVSEKIQECDAIVVVSPEWAGMVPSALKNFFLLCTRGELAHKPGLIVAVSASRGGAYPVAELRMSSYKNTHLCYIPDHVIVRDVRSILNDGEPASDDDRYIRDRLEYSVKLLDAYASALTTVRAAGVVDRKKYPFGM